MGPMQKQTLAENASTTKKTTTSGENPACSAMPWQTTIKMPLYNNRSFSQAKKTSMNVGSIARILGISAAAGYTGYSPAIGAVGRGPSAMSVGFGFFAPV